MTLLQRIIDLQSLRHGAEHSALLADRAMFARAIVIFEAHPTLSAIEAWGQAVDAVDGPARASLRDTISRGVAKRTPEGV